jgi:hypothetical protein
MYIPGGEIGFWANKTEKEKRNKEMVRIRDFMADGFERFRFAVKIEIFSQTPAIKKAPSDQGKSFCISNHSML